MARFNFTEILLTSKADITDIMNNFNKIEELGITSAEVNTKINTAKTTINQSIDSKLSQYTKTSALGKLALVKYSKGTNAPSGGANGDIYDQYF